MMTRRAVLALLLAGAPAVAAAPSKPAWFDSIDAAYLHAQQYRQPMLVFVGSDTVATSRQAWAELSTADAVGPWTAVRLSADVDRDAARSLGVVDVPTLLALTPDGRRVAVVDHPLAGQELSAWLDKQRAAATAHADAEPTIDGLVNELGDADPAERESAVRQPRDHPEAAAVSVVQVLAAGNQQQRLASTDLLDGWRAPGMDEIDPWAPETLTPARLAALRTWAKSAKPTTRSTDPSAADDLNALAMAPTAIVAGAVRERLLRFGPALLPQVVARIHGNPPEPARARLVALRYRLCATDRLAHEWPGGFDRVASADAQVRRQAAADLVDVAKAEDAQLLTELFADDDPFVREQSLRALRAVGGSDTNRALVRLLGDPEPNVRAAVLNTLADAPDDTLAGDLARFAAKEPDVDLVVHAVHVLELTPGATSFDAMISLLDHPQWRVRGEAAESLLGRISGEESTGITDEQKTTAYVALQKRLDDPEGYVVTRAAGTLIKSGLGSMVGPLLTVAQRRPDVARDVLKALANQPDVGRPFVDRIRSLAKSPQPGVRAVAVGALVELDPSSCGSDVAAALGDADAAVRAAAVRATVAVLTTLQPGEESPATSFPLNAWFAEFRAGRNRPQWLTDAAPSMERAMDTSSDPAIRINAAVVLCALGRDDQAWPVLTAAAARAGDAVTVAPALPWLPWERRAALFAAARRAGGAGATPRLLEAFTIVSDDKAAGVVWDLLAPGAANDQLSSVLSALNKLYTGSEYGYNASQTSPARQRRAIEDAKARVANGADLQRTAALAILLEVSPPDAAVAAKRVGEESKISEWLRLDALQIQLLAQPTDGDDTATPIAIAALNDRAHVSLRKVALPFLASGGEAINRLRGSAYLYSVSFRSTSYSVGDGQMILVKAPPGLTAEPLWAELARSDVDTDDAGYAGYLLVLLGEPSGMVALMSAARAHSMESPWDQLVYRAIAKSDDGNRVPVLTEIYESLSKRNKYQVREFYWTIRPMTGPAVLKLRKRIRDEYGMEKLR